MPTENQQLAHHVYFKLKDNSADKVQQLVDAIKKYLQGHPGETYFSVGTLAAELNREVNDRDFDVALCVVFESKQAHDAYQIADRHLEYIETNKDNWAQVRVFDFYHA